MPGTSSTLGPLLAGSLMLVVESTPQHRQTRSLVTNGEADTSDQPHLFVVSAKSQVSATKAISRLKAYAEENPGLALDALAHTLLNKRTHFPWRFAAVAHDTDSLIQTLSVPDALSKQVQVTQKNLTAFIFTGQGAQWAKMGAQLLPASKVFRESIEDSDEYLRCGLGAEWSLVEELSRDESTTRVNDSRFGQPTSTAVQLALVDLLLSWGTVPAAVLGHSSGEIAAAYAAGVLDRHAAMLVSYHRSFLGHASRQKMAKPGVMTAVGLGEEEVAKYLEGKQAGTLPSFERSPKSG